jgi:hypothetical protein
MKLFTFFIFEHFQYIQISTVKRVALISRIPVTFLQYTKVNIHIHKIYNLEAVNLNKYHKLKADALHLIATHVSIITWIIRRIFILLILSYF